MLKKFDKKSIETICLDVPFFGYKDVDLNFEVASTSCGMCCLYMALSAKIKKLPTITEMVGAGILEGGFSINGWMHNYFVEKLVFYNFIHAKRQENMSRMQGVQDIVNSIKSGYPVIVSGKKRFMEQTSFHMVLVVGFQQDEAGIITGIIYHDPALKNEEQGSYRVVSLDNFHQFWRRMAIFML